MRSKGFRVFSDCHIAGLPVFFCLSFSKGVKGVRRSVSLTRASVVVARSGNGFRVYMSCIIKGYRRLIYLGSRKDL